MAATTAFRPHPARIRSVRIPARSSGRFRRRRRFNRRQESNRRRSADRQNDLFHVAAPYANRENTSSRAAEKRAGGAKCIANYKIKKEFYYGFKRNYRNHCSIGVIFRFYCLAGVYLSKKRGWGNFLRNDRKTLKKRITIKSI